MINLELLEEEKPVELKLEQNSKGGTNNYNELENLPQINGKELKGDLSLEELGIIVNAIKDILINGKTIVDKDGNAVIPIANGMNKLGVAQYHASYGVSVNQNGLVTVMQANESVIDSRASNFLPIVPNNLDYAVKRAMTDGKGAEWTSEEKANARKRMGLGWSTVCDITLDEDTAIFELKDIECSELHVQVIGKISTRRVQIMLNNTNPQLYFDNAILTRDNDLTILDITISKRHDSDVCICTTKSSGTTTSGFHFGGTNYSATFKRNYDMINKLKLFLFSDGVATESVFRQGCRIVVYGR